MLIRMLAAFSYLSLEILGTSEQTLKSTFIVTLSSEILPTEWLKLCCVTTVKIKNREPGFPLDSHWSWNSAVRYYYK